MSKVQTGMIVVAGLIVMIAVGGWQQQRQMDASHAAAVVKARQLGYVTGEVGSR